MANKSELDPSLHKSLLFKGFVYLASFFITLTKCLYGFAVFFRLERFGIAAIKRSENTSETDPGSFVCLGKNNLSVADDSHDPTIKILQHGRGEFLTTGIFPHGYGNTGRVQEFQCITGVLRREDGTRFSDTEKDIHGPGRDPARQRPMWNRKCSTQRSHTGKIFRIQQGQTQSHRSAASEAGQKNPIRRNVTPFLSNRNTVENSLFGINQALFRVRPVEKCFGPTPIPENRRHIKARTIDIRQSAHVSGRIHLFINIFNRLASRGHGHMVSHADRWHDPHHLPFISAGSVKPNQQWIGITGFIMNRREKNMGVSCTRF